MNAIEEYEGEAAEGGFDYVLAGDLVAQVRADQKEAWLLIVTKAGAFDAAMTAIQEHLK